MKILVCIKQIPDTSDVKWTKDNNIIREGVISILNPCDLLAITSVRDIENAEISYLSMGPFDAKKSLVLALAMGGKAAYLLCDKKFKGADTLATAKTLSCAIKNYIKEYDLIVTGQFAKDGDTGQTPYSLANLLGLEHIGYVNKINEIDENGINVNCIKQDYTYNIKGKFPLVISISKCDKPVYRPLCADYIRAEDIEIEVLDAQKIGINPQDTGIKGSATYVSKAFRPENNRNCKFISSSGLKKELE